MMPTIDEAIGLLQNLGHNQHYNIYEADEEAIRLGIEALKLVKIAREGDYRLPIYWLPGELGSGA